MIAPNHSITARILSRSGHPVQHLVLEMPDGFQFRPGQYLEVVHSDGPIPLSIASAPHRLPELHLHYLPQPDAPEAARMDELLDAGRTLEIRGPAGNVQLPDAPIQPVLLVAGGTGAAQAMSFIDAYRANPPDVAVTLLWCADADSDFYLEDELRAIREPWFHCVLLADARRTPQNRGLQWLRRHGPSHRRSTIVLCGGPGFVWSAYDALADAGVAPTRMQSDVFSYAPRG
ncbi:MAG TPA: hypothetical protein VF210_12450 [Pseudomonadales bacterium]